MNWRLTISDLRPDGRVGTPTWQWEIDVHGGEQRIDGLVAVEIAPLDQVPERTRDYPAVRRLADAVERNGGYATVGGLGGTELRVGDEIVVGEDALQLVMELNRRAQPGNADAITEAFRRGHEAGVRAAREAVTATLDGVRP